MGGEEVLSKKWNWTKIFLTVAGAALMMASNFVQGKIQEDDLRDLINEELDRREDDDS